MSEAKDPLEQAKELFDSIDLRDYLARGDVEAIDEALAVLRKRLIDLLMIGASDFSISVGVACNIPPKGLITLNIVKPKDEPDA